MTTRKLFSLMFSFVLVAGACGSGDGGSGLSDTEQQLLDGLNDDTDFSGSLSTDEQLCLVRAVAANSTMATAILAGDEIDDLPPDLVTAFFELGIGCAPDAMADAMVEGMREDSNLSDDAQCLADALLNDPDLLIGLAAADEDDPDMGILMVFFEILDACDIPLSSFD